jgi:uncharacterized lipoprotein YddW (UPF0748 family)
MGICNLPSFRLPKGNCVAVFLFLLLQITGFLPLPAHASPRFGLWVEAEGENQPFRSRSEYDDFVAFTDNKNFSDLYCQVYRGGRSWYPSMLADDTPYRLARAQGMDPLGQTIKQAHSRGQRVHAWVNVLRVNRIEAPLLRIVGTEALQVDSYGNTALNYDDDGYAPGNLVSSFRLETPGVWLDPSSQKARQFIVEVIRDIVITYPDIDGVHLDMARYPATMSIGGSSSPRPDFGYSKQSVNGFYEFAGKPAPIVSAQLNSTLRKSPAWSAWRRAQVTLLVFEIKEMLNEIAPEVELSAAVMASPERAYSEVFQDWTEWLKGGVLDTAIPMSYSKDNNVVAQYSHFAVTSASRNQVLIGLGAWLMKGNPSQLAAQGRIALRAGAKGVVLFSYSNLAYPGGKDLIHDFFESIHSLPN